MKGARNFISRVQTSDERADPLTAKAVFVLKDKNWKHVRLGTPLTFTSRKEKKKIYLTDKCTKEVNLYLNKKTADVKFRFLPVINRRRICDK
jgi:hypothetical protein